MPHVTPPDDWDFTIHDVRLCIDESKGLTFDQVKDLLYTGVVLLEWYEHGVWSALAQWPAFMLGTGGLGVLSKPVPPPAPDGEGTSYRSLHALSAPQPVRAARTRITFPASAYIVLDGIDRGSDLLYPVWSKVSPFIISTARNVTPECPT